MLEIRGVGLHSGEKSIVRFFVEEGSVRFRRGNHTLLAHIDSVLCSDRCTVLGNSGFYIATVEHLLAALYVHSIWEHLLIEVVGDELPALDGSAREWSNLLQQLQETLPPAGVSARHFEKIDPGKVEIVANDSRIAAVPNSHLELDVSILFNHPHIGFQQLCVPSSDLASLLDARTFGFFSEREALLASGRAAGASFDNALVFSEQGMMNAPRFPDEPVRHKALDLLGDLYLLGRPLSARVIAHRASHRLHLALCRALLSSSR